MEDVQEPINRSKFRHFIGREYYILCRKLQWLQFNKWAGQKDFTVDGYPVHRHRSFIMRPLKDVEMYLQENKRTNLALAIEKLDGTVIDPGETFSVWRQVGRPTASKGYLEGLVLNQGKIDKGTGGGLCQMGNLLFWIFAHSPLQIVERYRHGFDVFPDVNRKVPFGAGATLSYNYIDLQVKNTTMNRFQLRLWLDEEHLNGELIARSQVRTDYHVEERNHLIKQQWWGGYTRHNQIWKIAQHDDGRLDESLLVENHAIMMYDPFLEQGSGSSC